MKEVLYDIGVLNLFNPVKLTEQVALACIEDEDMENDSV